MVKTAKFFSYLLHPAFMPIVGMIVLFNTGIYETDIPFKYQRYTYFIVVIFSILLPLSIIPILKYWNLITSIELDKRKERIIPFVVTSLCLVFLHLFISKVIPIHILNKFTFAVALLSVILFFVNIFYKISMHLMAIGGVTGLIIAVTLIYEIRPFYWLAGMIICAGIAASSRLLLNAHTTLQVLVAYILGFVVVFTLLYY